MKNSRTPRYVVGFNTSEPSQFDAGVEWKLDVHGQPTEDNLRKFCAKFEESTQSGGCNEHLGPMKIIEAWLIDQEGTQVVTQVVFENFSVL